MKTMPCFLNSVHFLVLWRNSVLETTSVPSGFQRCRGTYTVTFTRKLKIRYTWGNLTTIQLQKVCPSSNYNTNIEYIQQPSQFVCLFGGTTYDSYPKMRTMSVANHKLLHDATHEDKCLICTTVHYTMMVLCHTYDTYLLTPWSRVFLEKLTGRILWNPKVHFCTHKCPPYMIQFTYDTIELFSKMWI